MAKKRADFSLMTFDTPAPAKQAAPEVPASITITDADLPKKVVGLYIQLEEHKRQEIREWCTRHKKSLRDVLLEGYASYTKQYGP